MKFPIIKVRDKLTGHEHIVGTDSHDTLFIDKETGGIHYYNLQNGEGTRGDYEFVGVDTEYDPDTQIEFVTVDQLEIQRLRAALKWYGQEENYVVPHIGCTSKVMIDRGAKARQALSITTSTGAERVREEIADRYKNALHGRHNPVDRAAGSYYNGYLNGVRETLRILGIIIPGINVPE